MFLKEQVAAAAPVAESAAIQEGAPEVSVGTLAEILYEAEAAYGNLVRRMMTIEHKAIVNEDSALLEGAVSDFWEKFKAWVKEWFGKVKAYFTHVADKVRLAGDSGLKWLDSVKDRTFGEADVEVSPGVADGSAINKLKEMSGKLKASAASKVQSGTASAKQVIDETLGLASEKAASITDAMKEHVLGPGKRAAKISGEKAKEMYRHVCELMKEAVGMEQAVAAEERELAAEAAKGNDDEKTTAEMKRSVALQKQSAISGYISTLNATASQLKEALKATLSGAKEKVAAAATSVKEKVAGAAPAPAAPAAATESAEPGAEPAAEPASESTVAGAFLAGALA